MKKQVSTLTPLGGYDVQPSSAWVSLEFSRTTAENGQEGRKKTDKHKVTGQLKRHNSSFMLLFYHVSLNMYVNSVTECMTKKKKNTG